MNVGQLINKVNSYMQINFQRSGVSDNDPMIIAKANELSLLALNNARLVAEQVHDFVCEESRVVLTVSPLEGGSLEDVLYWVPGDSPLGAVNVKNVIGAWTIGSDGYPGSPVQIRTGRKNFLDKLEERSNGFFNDYPEDQTVRETRIYSAYRFGSVIRFWPQLSEDVSILLDCYRWLDDYVSNDDSDWFTERGSNYLFYAAVCEVNHVWQTMVFRQEGTVSPPEKDRDRALQMLIDHDIHSQEDGDFPDQE